MRNAHRKYDSQVPQELVTMRVTLQILCVAVIAHLTIGCGSSGKEEPSDTQFMAVCITKQEHEGNEYVLTRWLNSKEKALVYGREHSRKKKGHEVIYRERPKQ